MKLVIHQGMVQADSYNCLECHSNIGHVYAQPSARVDGWYSVEQADAGMKLFEQSCSGCPAQNWKAALDRLSMARPGNKNSAAQNF